VFRRVSSDRLSRWTPNRLASEQIAEVYDARPGAMASAPGSPAFRLWGPTVTLCESAVMRPGTGTVTPSPALSAGYA